MERSNNEFYDIERCHLYFHLTNGRNRTVRQLNNQNLSSLFTTNSALQFQMKNECTFLNINHFLFLIVFIQSNPTNAQKTHITSSVPNVLDHHEKIIIYILNWTIFPVQYTTYRICMLCFRFYWMNDECWVLAAGASGTDKFTTTTLYTWYLKHKMVKCQDKSVIC